MSVVASAFCLPVLVGPCVRVRNSPSREGLAVSAQLLHVRPSDLLSVGGRAGVGSGSTAHRLVCLCMLSAISRDLATHTSTRVYCRQ